MSEKITIFQLDDTDNSQKIIDIGASSMLLLYSPLATIKDFIANRQQIVRPGVYILKYDSADDQYKDNVYIGEAEDVKERLKEHLRDDPEEFKECVVVVSTKDGELAKAHVKNMEAELYKRVKSAKNSLPINKQIPVFSSLSLADADLVSKFVNQLQKVLPLCGFYCLIPTTAQISALDNTFELNSKGITAKMVSENNKYIVLKDSTACKEVTKAFSQTYADIRKKLIDSNCLTLENDHYIFTENAVFDSPSQAACVIVGSPINGLTSWKNSNGITMKELQQ